MEVCLNPQNEKRDHFAELKMSHFLVKRGCRMYMKVSTYCTKLVLGYF